MSRTEFECRMDFDTALWRLNNISRVDILFTNCRLNAYSYERDNMIDLAVVSLLMRSYELSELHQICKIDIIHRKICDDISEYITPEYYDPLSFKKTVIRRLATYYSGMNDTNNKSLYDIYITLLNKLQSNE
jgi:hypothetical protein